MPFDKVGYFVHLRYIRDLSQEVVKFEDVMIVCWICCLKSCCCWWCGAWKAFLIAALNSSQVGLLDCSVCDSGTIRGLYLQGSWVHTWCNLEERIYLILRFISIWKIHIFTCYPVFPWMVKGWMLSPLDL